MAISRFNPEGYYDPVAYEVLSKIEEEERRKQKDEDCLREQQDNEEVEE